MAMIIQCIFCDRVARYIRGGDGLCANHHEAVHVQKKTVKGIETEIKLSNKEQIDFATKIQKNIKDRGSTSIDPFAEPKKKEL